ncbi:MAG: outer membrane beta-barrel protein [Coxiellaceae bacterium]|nr:outer membrane beta-barrel protein [Coxiellaceae bacterium]
MERKILSLLALFFTASALAGGPAPMVAPAPAFVPDNGFYFGGHAGLGTFQAVDMTTNEVNGGVSSVTWGTSMQRSSFDFVWDVGFGYRMEGGFFFNVSYQDLGFRTLDFSTTLANGGGSNANQGAAEIDSDVYIANFFYEFTRAFDLSGRAMPYIGAGVGFSSNKIKDRHNDAATVAGVRVTYVTGHTDTEFAWDAAIGLHYYISPEFIVDLRYTFVYAGDVDFGDHIHDINFVQTGEVTGGETVPVRSNVFSIGLSHII